MRRIRLRLSGHALPAIALGILPAAAVAVAPAGAHAAVHIELAAQRAIGSGEVRLGDIAQVAGADEAEVARIRSLPLGTDLIGARQVDRSALARFVRARTGLGAEDIAWSGATAVRLQNDLVTVPQERLVDVAQASLSGALARLKGRVVLKASAADAALALPRGEVRFQPRPLPADFVPTRHMVVWVDVTENGRFVRAVPVGFEVSVLVTGWAARRQLVAGSQVTLDAVEPRDVDLTSTYVAGEVVRRTDDTFRAPGEALMLRDGLRPGEVLTWRNAVPVPLVARGVPATLRLHGQAIDIESRVQVMDDGFMGQTVRVKAIGATGAILAKVTGPGVLEAQQ
jgi:flagella basal body P-ring formation protein FlgA